jgi:hypothetical protein
MALRVVTDTRRVHAEADRVRAAVEAMPWPEALTPRVRLDVRASALPPATTASGTSLPLTQLAVSVEVDGPAGVEAAFAARAALHDALARVHAALEGADPDDFVPLAPPSLLAARRKRKTEVASQPFAALGVEFPLFRAPIALAASYDGPGFCLATRRDAPDTVGVDAIEAPCPRCAAPAWRGHTLAACPSCGAPVLPHRSVERPRVALEVLAAGRARIVQHTALGLLEPGRALDGVTPEAAAALGATPRIASWNEVAWPFHAGRPMALLGDRAAHQLGGVSLPDADRAAVEAARAVRAQGGWLLFVDPPSGAARVLRDRS